MPATTSITTSRPASVRPGMAWIPGGIFTMGSDEHGPEEDPPHLKAVDGFWIDRCPVTNRDFGEFVAVTGYVTVAERPREPAGVPGPLAEDGAPGSLVFVKPAGPVEVGRVEHVWRWTPGASWRHPEGPGSSIARRYAHPVVHVAAEDAEVYAAWAGLALPTEAEWERAARSGVEGAAYAWGDDPEPPGKALANHWRGDFPWRAEPGFGSTTPVCAFPATRYGLYDMAGNVWEWTADLFSSHHPEGASAPGCMPVDPWRPEEDRRVIKGGSFLCTERCGQHYRPAARRPQMVDTAMSNVGFRCVARDEP